MQIKLVEAIQKQTTLAARVLDGTATPAERAEAAALNAVIAQAMQPQAACKSQLDTMTAAEFEAHVAAEMGAMEKGADAWRVELLKRNIADVQRQADAGKTVFAVAVPVVEKVDPLAAALARIAELEKKFDGRFVTGVGDPKAPEPVAEPAPVVAPAAEAAPQADPPAAAEPVAEPVDKGKPFPGAAPPFGADGKPVEETPEEKKKRLAEAAAASAKKADEVEVDKAKVAQPAPPPAADQAPAAAPEGDGVTEECKGCGKLKKKGAPCENCGAVKNDTAKAHDVWAADLAAAVGPKSAVEAYRMVKAAGKKNG
jgi:hypothetical protein